MIAELVANGIEGGSWEGVRRNMTLPRVRSIQKYWKKQPPVSWLVAAYIKYKPPEPPVKILQGRQTRSSRKAMKASEEAHKAGAEGTEPKPVDDNNMAGLVSFFGLKPGMKVRM